MVEEAEVDVRWAQQVEHVDARRQSVETVGCTDAAAAAEEEEEAAHNADTAGTTVEDNAAWRAEPRDTVDDEYSPDTASDADVEVEAEAGGGDDDDDEDGDDGRPAGSGSHFVAGHVGSGS